MSFAERRDLMRPRTMVIGVLAPSFACWWGGFLLVDAGATELPPPAAEAWLAACAVVAVALGARALVRAPPGDRAWRAGAVAAFLGGWLTLSLVGGGLVLLPRLRESGLVPWLVLPIFAASLTSLALGLWATGGDLPGRWRWALGGLGAALLALWVFSWAPIF